MPLFRKNRAGSPHRAGSAEELRRHLRRSRDLVVQGWNLDGVDLSGRALIGITFVGCELTMAKFAGSDLSTARFVGCNLYGADFDGAVLYTTWFYECNLTKASFCRSYVLGFRLRNVDITKAAFDRVPLIAMERKSRVPVSGRLLTVPLLARLPTGVLSIERDYDGMVMIGCPHPIAFIRGTGDEQVRLFLRTAETAKYLRSVHAENGYEERADDYYVVERRQRRRALRGGLLRRGRRATDYVLGDLLWRYGTRPSRPVVALFLSAMSVSAITFAAPSLDPGTGLRPSADSAPYQYDGFGFRSAVSFLNVAYFFLTSTVGGSEAELSGWVKVVFVGYVLTAIWLIALVFEASTRRLGRSR